MVVVGIVLVDTRSMVGEMPARSATHGGRRELDGLRLRFQWFLEHGRRRPYLNVREFHKIRNAEVGELVGQSKQSDARYQHLAILCGMGAHTLISEGIVEMALMKIGRGRERVEVKVKRDGGPPLKRQANVCFADGLHTSPTQRCGCPGCAPKSTRGGSTYSFDETYVCGRSCCSLHLPIRRITPCRVEVTPDKMSQDEAQEGGDRKRTSFVKLLEISHKCGTESFQAARRRLVFAQDQRACFARSPGLLFPAKTRIDMKLYIGRFELEKTDSLG